MANNYVLFSEEIEVTREQALKLEEMFQNCRDVEDLGEPCEFELNEIDSDQYGFWMHSTESCDLERTVEVLEEFTKEYAIEEPIVFAWAYTCSEPRVGEFGGGAVAIYKGESRWVDAGTEADKLAEEMMGVG